MTKLKRLVAVVLAVLMMLGSLSMMAFAENSTSAPTLGIETKIFRNVDGEWVQAEKVKQGETVKARVYLDTNYYTNSGNLLFFYNNSFFSDSYPSGSNTLIVNPVYANSPYTIAGTFLGSDSSSVEAYLVALGAIDSDFADKHEFFNVSYIFDGSSYNQKFDGNKWFCEFDLTVKEDANGAGDLFAVEETTLSPSFPYGRINVPKGEYNEKVAGVASMANWEATLNYTSNPVTLYNNAVKVSFDVVNGEFPDGTTTKSFEGESGTALSVDNPTRAKYTFKGWTVKGGDGSIADVTAYPATSTEYVAVWEEIETDKETLHLETKFYRNIGTEAEPNWVYTEKAKRGEALRARIFVDTSYYTNAGDIIVFFDNKFFTDTYQIGHNELTINNETGSAVTNGVKGSFAKLTRNSLEIESLINYGYITSSFAEENTAFTIEYSFDANGSKFVVNDWQTDEDGTVKIADDSDEWIFEFELQVSSSASGEDYFWIEPKTIMNPDEGSDAYINIPLSKNGDINTNNTPLFLVDVDETVVNNPVSLETSITLDADKGTFVENSSDILVLEGMVGDTVIAPQEPTKDGYTFMGWVDENGDAAEIPATMPYEEITLTAVWQPQVNISFDTDGDVNTPADITRVETSGQPFVAPADPTKEGYEFVGWTKDDTLATFTGLDPVYPDTDRTYYALYDVVEYTVTYYVRDIDTLEYVLVTEIPVAYGDKVPAVPSTYKAPEGYSVGKSYTNGSLTAELPANATMPAADMDIYFKLVPNEYDAIFDANGGAWADGTDKQTVKATYDSQITAPEAPIREGYEFTGWTPDVAIMDEEGKTFIANWDEKVYNAVYKVDGSVYEQYEVEFGAPVDKPADPYKEGYTFIEWSPAVDATMPAHDTEYIAVFDINSHDATFDPGEGGWPKVDDEGNPVVDENGKPVIDSTDKVIEDIDYNAPIDKPADPVKEGYVFGGWEPIPDTMPDKDTTYTATWNPATDTPYVVEIYTMDTDGISYKLTDTQNKTGTTGAVIDLAVSAPTNFSIDTEKSTYDNKVTIAADGSTVVTVYYARDSYTITFDGNYGTVDNEASISKVYYYGASVAVPTTNRTGYTFTGWKDADGKDVIVNITATADATYIAQWDVNEYTITFNTDGGTEFAPITQDYGTDIEDPGKPQKEGYTFDKWVDENNNDATVPTVMPDKDTTLKAIWTINYYDISLDAEGGKLANGNETYAATDVAYDTDLAAYGVPMGEPTKTGYTFLGWSETEGSETAEIDEIPATMPADDIIYYAVWDVNEYTITFNTDGGTEFAPITQDYGTNVTDPGKPEKEGHTFEKWVDENGNEVSVPTTMPEKNVTLKAIYTTNSYKVTYSGEGVTTTEYDVAYGAAIPVPAVPTRTGYTFGGWLEKTSSKYNTDYTSMPANDLEFVAQWNNIQGVKYYFDVYKMGVDGKYPDTPERSTLVGEANATATVEYEVPKGFKLESYELSGTVSADLANPLVLYAKVAREEYDFVAYLEKGSTTVVAKGTYLFEAPVAAVGTPTNPGYVFDGWVYEDGTAAEIPTAMPANDVTVYATWVEDEFTASFDAGEGEFPNGDKVVTDDVTFGEDIEAPAQEPVRDGYEFVGWAPADIENPTEDDVVKDYGKMDEDGEDFQAVWVKNVYTVNFYDYVPVDGDERQTPMNAELVIVPSPKYENGEKIVFPSTADLYEYDHYVFKGWTDAEGVKIYNEESVINFVDTDNVIAGTELVNGTDGSINFYAVYERVKVMLIPEQSPATPGFTVTTIIDRGSEENTVDDYVDGESVWFVYGLQTKLKETKLLNDYIDVQGDGRIEIEYRKKDDGSTFEPYTGTGTVINVYDNVTDELVESFYIVIFGDLDGDSYIKAADADIADQEALGYTHWSKTAPVFKDDYRPYMHKAADVGENRTGKIDTADALIIEERALGYCYIDQTDASVIERL